MSIGISWPCIIHNSRSAKAVMSLHFLMQSYISSLLTIGQAYNSLTFDFNSQDIIHYKQFKTQVILLSTSTFTETYFTRHKTLTENARNYVYQYSTIMYHHNATEYPVKWTPYVNEITGDHPCGFHHNRSTINQIFYISHIPEKKWEFNGMVYQLFINFKKDYDSVKR
jgi:hypothetical protein